MKTQEATTTKKATKAKAAKTSKPAPKETAAKTTKAAKSVKATKGAEPKREAKATRAGSKTAIILDLLRRRDGASIAEIAEATNWLNHSIRGFLSGQVSNKMGLKLESEKVDGERRYRLPA